MRDYTAEPLDPFTQYVEDTGNFLGYDEFGFPVFDIPRPLQIQQVSRTPDRGFFARNRGVLALATTAVTLFSLSYRSEIRDGIDRLVGIDKPPVAAATAPMPASSATENANIPEQSDSVSPLIIDNPPSETAESLPSESKHSGLTSSGTKDVKNEPTIAWPVNEKYWKQNRGAFLKGHTGGGNFLGGPDDVSLDLQPNGLSSCGLPVFSMLDGVVIKSPIGKTGGNGVEVRSKFEGSTVTISYAHGQQNTHKKTVKAGQQIMTIGKTGNATGCHIHMDMMVDNKPVCPQDIFIAMGNDNVPNFAKLEKKANAPCGRL